MTRTRQEFEYHHDIAMTNELYNMLRLYQLAEGAFHRKVEISTCIPYGVHIVHIKFIFLRPLGLRLTVTSIYVHGKQGYWKMYKARGGITIDSHPLFSSSLKFSLLPSSLLQRQFESVIDSKTEPVVAIIVKLASILW